MKNLFTKKLIQMLFGRDTEIEYGRSRAYTYSIPAAPGQKEEVKFTYRTGDGFISTILLKLRDLETRLEIAEAKVKKKVKK